MYIALSNINISLAIIGLGAIYFSISFVCFISDLVNRSKGNKMRIALDNTIISLIPIFVGLTFLIISFSFLSKDLTKRLYPNGNKQPLVTTCQVDAKIRNQKEKSFDGYILENEQRINVYIDKESINDYLVQIYLGFSSPGSHDIPYQNFISGQFKQQAEKIGCEISEIIDDEINTKYYCSKWIPKKDFHKYYTLEKLSELMNKTKRR